MEIGNKGGRQYVGICKLILRSRRHLFYFIQNAPLIRERIGGCLNGSSD